MKPHDVSAGLRSTRERLNEVQEELRELDHDDLRRPGLRNEETELRARLVRLQDSALKDHDTQEIPGVPGAPASIRRP
jgi:hypothetical protein